MIDASFVAAPEVFPPDTFNSGFIVLNPNKKEFKRIMDANKKIGSAEGNKIYSICSKYENKK